MAVEQQEITVPRSVRIEIQFLGNVCGRRGERIGLLQEQLAELNRRYPGERVKRFAERDQRYNELRAAIQRRMDLLVFDQRNDRQQIKSIL